MKGVDAFESSKSIGNKIKFNKGGQKVMLVVIAKITNSKNEVEACRILDTNSNETRLISVKRIKEAILKNPNNRIKGYRLVDVTDYFNGQLRKHIIREKSNTYNFTKCPNLNGSGELRNPADSKLLVYGGWKGYAECKKHYLYNYKGEETVADREQLVKLIKQNLVNGAVYDSIKDRIAISDELNHEKP